MIVFEQCTEVRFASLLSGGFTTMAVINPPESRPLCSAVVFPSPALFF